MARPQKNELRQVVEDSMGLKSTERRVDVRKGRRWEQDSEADTRNKFPNP